MKRYISLLLVVLLIAMPMVVLADSAEPVLISVGEPVFTDISGHWAESIITDYADRGFLEGYPDGSFKPDQEITNAELIALINRFFGFQMISEMNYDDVIGNEWFADETARAKYINYVESAMVYPNDYASRISLVNMLDLIIDTDEENIWIHNTEFTDTGDLDEAHEEKLKAFSKLGYLEGYPDGTFRPYGTVKRAEAITVIYRILGFIVKTQDDLENIPEGTIKVSVISPGIIIEDMIFDGDLYITAGAVGVTTLKNVNVRGMLIISGGSNAEQMVLEGVVTPRLVITSNREFPSILIKDSRITELMTKSQAEITIVDSKINSIAAYDFSALHIGAGSSVVLLDAFVPVEVDGSGKIHKAMIHRGGNGTIIQVRPVFVEVAPDIDGAMIGGENIDSTNDDREIGQYAYYGTGAENNPYKIFYIEDLASIGQVHFLTGSMWELDANYILMNNLNFYDENSYYNAYSSYGRDWDGDGESEKTIMQQLGSEIGWMPIGTSDNPFTGTFNGQNKIISGLYFRRYSESNVGLFGLSQNAVFSNLGLVSVDIGGEEDTGALVGEAEGYDGVIDNVWSSGVVDSYDDDIGGIVGDLEDGVIKNSHSSANVYAEDRAGGLVGELENATIINCYATGTVQTDEERAGGLVGSAFDESTIKFSYATGNVQGLFYVGGLAGYVSDGSWIDYCYAMGDVEAGGYEDESDAGGLVGGLRGADITNSYATGDASGDEDNVGGLLGSSYYYENASNTSYIMATYAIGDVYSGDDNSGGLIGEVDDTSLEISVAFGDDVYADDSDAFRVVGDLDSGDSSMEFCYANENMVSYSDEDGDTSGDNNYHYDDGGEDLANMTDINEGPFAAWDFGPEDTDGDGGYWMMKNDRPVIYVDPDGDGVFVQLGPDNGLID